MVVEERDRYKLEHILKVVEAEYERQMEFGYFPGVANYTIVIREWLEEGLMPGDNR